MLPLALVSLGFASISTALPAPQESATPGSDCSGDSNAPRNLLISGNNFVASATFDPATNEFTLTANEQVAEDPTWIAPSNGLIYRVHELGNDTGVLQNQEAFPSLQVVDSSGGLVHLEFNKDKTVLFGASFGEGKVDIFDVDAEGQLGNFRSLLSEGTLGPVTERQGQPRVHQVIVDPSGDFVAFNDLGLDAVSVIGKKSADSDFEILGSVASQPGCGPRHGAFFPVGGDQATHYFLLCEISEVVEIFDVTYADGVMSLAQTGKTFSTYPPDGEFARNASGPGAAAELLISPDSAHVYVTNRISDNPTDSIARFDVTGVSTEVQDNGDVVATIGDIGLELADLVSSGGINPRMASMSKDGTLLFAVNQFQTATNDSLGVVAFKRDVVTGNLEQLGGLPLSLFIADNERSMPACIQEV